MNFEMTTATLHPLPALGLSLSFQRTERVYESYGDRGVRKGSARIHEVFLNGIRIGELYKDYEPGCVVARNCVGGSYPGAWVWHFTPEEEIEITDGILLGDHYCLKDIKSRLQWALVDRVAAGDLKDYEICRVNPYLRYVATKMVKRAPLTDLRDLANMIHTGVMTRGMTEAAWRCGFNALRALIDGDESGAHAAMTAEDEPVENRKTDAPADDHKTDIEVCTYIPGQGITALGTVRRAIRSGCASVSGARRAVLSDENFKSYVLAPLPRDADTNGYG